MQFFSEIDFQKSRKIDKKLKRIDTLVLDLDQTLVHYQEIIKSQINSFLKKEENRPFAEEFIETLSKQYEIVIFTAALSDYSNFIKDIIDKNEVVQQRLYRDQTVFKVDVYIKDLSKLNKNLSKFIIVDNMPENFKLQPENEIYFQAGLEMRKIEQLKILYHCLNKLQLKSVTILEQL